MRIAVIGGVLLGWTGCATKQSVASLEADVAALQADVVALQQRVEAQEAELKALHASAVPAHAAASANPVEPKWLVQQTDGRYRLEADFTQLDMMWFSRQLRTSPHKGPDGSVDGLRLGGIRPLSLLAELGFRNGDVVHAVNGYALSSMQASLEMFQALKPQPGKPLTLRIECSRRNRAEVVEIELVETHSVPGTDPPPPAD